MNILLNCSTLKIGGGLQVAHSFIHELLKHEEHNYIIVLSSVLSKQLDKVKFGDNFIFYEYDKKASPTNTILSKDRFLDSLVSKYSIEKVFTVFGPSYWKPKVKHICGYAKPHYIYKNSPFFSGLTFKEKLTLKLKEFFHILDFRKNNNIIITENEDVSNKLREIINKKIFTVTNNYNQIFNQPEDWDIIKLPVFEGKYLLTITANYPHKNLVIIPKVIEELLRRGQGNKFKFVVTLDQDSLSDNTEINNQIVYLGKVNINQCPSLYQQSDFLFLPTLLECFSASYAEAMKMEIPILTSNLGFAKGICQDAAFYFDPQCPKSITDILLSISNKEIDNLIIKGRERLKCFDTSKDRAIKYLQIIKEA